MPKDISKTDTHRISALFKNMKLTGTSIPVPFVRIHGVLSPDFFPGAIDCAECSIWQRLNILFWCDDCHLLEQRMTHC